MCGRARLSSDVSEIKVAFRIPPERPTPNFAASWNVAPTDPLPVVHYDAKDHQRSLEVMRWGLVPFWAKDIKVGFANINAKAEGIENKPAFREVFVPNGCAANPQTTFETSRSLKTVSSPLRVLVVGGGIAGMHAARMLKRQGQNVTIHEASETLGGQIRYSRRVQPDHGALADWLSLQLHKLNVPVVMGSSVSVEDVRAMDPDVVVVATGARGGALRADKEDCSVPVFDIFSAMDLPVGEWIGEVAMLGGDHASCHAAQHLARQGVKIHIITSAAALADDKAPITALFLANQLAKNDRLVVHPETTTELLTGKRVKIQSRGRVSELSVDAVVIGGRVSQFGLAEDLQRAGVGAMVYKIGDAASPRNVFSASHEAAEVSNDFILVGPKSDPAHIGGGTDILAAFRNIADAKAPFVARGDDSGTSKAEMRLWKEAGIDPKTMGGSWYRDTGSGMGPTLNTAAAMDGYTLSDRGTWLSFKNKQNLTIVVEGDRRLFNQYGVMLVNPAKHPHVKHDLGRKFIDWLISANGQKTIADYKINGAQLFFPNAKGSPS